MPENELAVWKKCFLTVSFRLEADASHVQNTFRGQHCPNEPLVFFAHELFCPCVGLPLPSWWNCDSVGRGSFTIRQNFAADFEGMVRSAVQSTFLIVSYQQSVYQKTGIVLSAQKVAETFAANVRQAATSSAESMSPAFVPSQAALLT